MFYFEEEKIIPFTNYRYRLNTFGQVIDYDKEVLKIDYVNDVAMVTFNWVFGVRSYELGVVVVITAMNINIPPSFFDRIEVIYSDNNKKNTVPSNLSYRFKNFPVEVESNPGFYYIPLYTRYGISKNGEIINLERNTLLLLRPTPPGKTKNITGGYLTGTAKKDIGESKHISRHRALGLTFLRYEKNPAELVINHKNGKPGDDRLENLEWTTRKENNIHAINSGLTPNSVVVVLMKNLETGKIDRYNSIAECGRAIGMSDSFVRVRLRRTKTKRYYDNLVFKEDDGSEWPHLDDVVSSKWGHRSVVAKNVFTGECFIFGSPTEAGDEVGVWDGGVRRIADTEGKRPINGYIFRYLTDRVEWPSYSFKELEMFRCSPTKEACGILVKNINGEEVSFHGNTNAATKVYGISHAEIRRYCHGKKRKDGLIFSFYKVKY